jgi:hypothetical protein
VGSHLFDADRRTDRRTDGRTDMTKLTVTYRNFAIAHKNTFLEAFSFPFVSPQSVTNHNDNCDTDVLQLQLMKDFSFKIHTFNSHRCQNTKVLLSLYFPILPMQYVEKCYSVQ